MHNWKKTRLETVVDIGSSKRIFYKEYAEFGIPFFRSKEVIEKSKKNSISTSLFISVDKFEEIKSKFDVPKKGDILLTSVGTLGVPWLIDEDKPFYFKDGNLTWIKGFSPCLLNKYLYYWILSPIGRGALDNISIGSTQPAITISGLKGLEVNLPTLQEQKQIVSVLSSLDDKIDLLKRQNKTLEALAETLFRQWFIEEAKDDWDKCRLGELVQFKYGKALKKSLRTGVGYPVVGSGGVVDFHTEALVKGVGIVTGRKGTLGDQHYFWDGFFPIDTTFYIVPKRQTKNMLFEYFLLRTIDFKRMNSDSAVPGLNREIAESAKIINPPSSLKVQFDEGVGPLFDKIRFNNLQIKTLENIRDLLLPKLMNGEVRVSYEGSHA